MRLSTPTLALLLVLPLAARAQDPARVVNQAGGPTQMMLGQVINEDGLPLPGATILIKGTRLVYSTNADGYFAFPSPRASEQVRVSLLGYTEAELSVRPQSTNAVTLQLLPGTRIRHGGRHNGKVLAVGRSQE